jgi:hypothetical protein
MDRIHHCARLVLLRAIGFATLAIGTLMVGLSWNAALALAAGATLAALVGVVLLYKAYAAPRTDYRRTELWLLLDRRHDLAEERAQEIIGGLLGRLYRRYAEYALAAAAGLWLLSVAARLA